MADLSKPATPSKEDKEPERYKVTNADGSRVLFEGNEKDARDHITNNYPRVHSEPGANYGDDGPPPSAVLSSSGGKEFYNGAEWVPVKESK